ncbi:hypothetical protein HWV62_5361 [Athelia sp. TMB]|nr:hypothetical protein HWV62_5361 [Athelia sp. TMB]
MPKLRRVQMAYKPSVDDKLPATRRGFTRGTAGARRNAGRGDGANWSGKYFLSGPQVDGYPDLEEPEAEGDMTLILQMIDDLEARERIASRALDISLFEIAQPAKVKKSAKRSQMMQKYREVITLRDDGTDEDFEMVDIVEEDWESVYAEDMQPLQRKTYSEILQGDLREKYNESG